MVQELPPFRVATWNVNSLRIRKPRLFDWLAKHRPDVVCLQELKMPTDQFSALEFLQLGYRAVWVGQKAYNGVAILSREEHGVLTNVHESLLDEDEDKAARLIAATIPGLGVKVMSVYVPNGQMVPSEKFDYKLKWLSRFKKYLETYCDKDEPLMIGGDFNVAPDDRDVYNPEGWKDSVICHKDARAGLADIFSFGLYDTLRLYTQDPNIYTYWDYQQLAFPKNLGLRIDHILITKPLVPLCKKAWVDRESRKGEKPSDHAPYVVEFGH